MLNILSEAKKQFEEINTLLDSQEEHNSDYFTNLSIATEEAYFTMNSGMCSNSTVCQNCSDHRDFIRSMLDVLGELEVDASNANNYTEELTQFSEHINAVLKDISSVMSTL